MTQGKNRTSSRGKKHLLKSREGQYHPAPQVRLVSGFLASSHAAGVAAVWVLDARHEAMRDLVRARDAAAKDYKSKRQNVSSFLLRLGLHYPGKKTWGRSHMNWLTSLKLEHREQRIAFEEMLLAVRQARDEHERSASRKLRTSGVSQGSEQDGRRGEGR